MAGPYLRARTVAAALALVVVGGCVGGCANNDADDNGQAGTGNSGGGAAGATTTAPPDGDGNNDNGDGGPNGSPTTAPGGQKPPPATTPTREETTTVPPSGDSGATGPVGAYGRALLRPPANSNAQGTVVFDVLAQEGTRLRTSTTRHLVEVLTRESGKPVDITTSEPVPGNRRSWTAAAIVAAADEHATLARTPAKPVIRVLVLRGAFAEQDSAIGVAVRGDVFAIFTEQITRAATPLVPPSMIEDAVTIHELGHLLGLVDLVVDRNREDPQHPSHSTNRNSVMYWAIESDLVAQVLDGPPANDFDADDQADLAAIRGGA